MKKPGCDHLSVTIRRIIRALSLVDGCRIIGGECNHCSQTVQRTQTATELKTGVIGSWYK